MTIELVSVREASFVADVPVKTVNKAIDEARLRHGVIRRRRERLLKRSGVLQLALEKELEQKVAPDIRSNVRARFLKAVSSAGQAADIVVSLGDSITLVIECKSITQRIDQRWQRLSQALDQIVEDPEIQAGAPTFKGTRILVWPIVQAMTEGETEATLLKHYPGLNHEKLEAARLYAEVRPPRGRPKLDARRAASRPRRPARRSRS
jgi:uncharacterized protein (DUF433 family)